MFDQDKTVNCFWTENAQLTGKVYGGGGMETLIWLIGVNWKGVDFCLSE